MGTVQLQLYQRPSEGKYHQKAPLSTIIDRAKKHGLSVKKPQIGLLHHSGSSLHPVSKSTKGEKVSVSGVSTQTAVSIGQAHLLPSNGENCRSMPTDIGTTARPRAG